MYQIIGNPIRDYMVGKNDAKEKMGIHKESRIGILGGFDGFCGVLGWHGSKGIGKIQHNDVNSIVSSRSRRIAIRPPHITHDLRGQVGGLTNSRTITQVHMAMHT